MKIKTFACLFLLTTTAWMMTMMMISISSTPPNKVSALSTNAPKYNQEIINGSSSSDGAGGEAEMIIHGSKGQRGRGSNGGADLSRPRPVRNHASVPGTYTPAASLIISSLMISTLFILFFGFPI